MDRKVAEEIKSLILACIGQLDQSVKIAMQEAPEEHASIYRRLTGQVMGHLFTEVLMPIYDSYPDLEPEELKQAKQKDNLSIMPLETGSKLKKVSSEVTSELGRLRANLNQMNDEDIRRLGSALQIPLESLQDVSEYLNRVCPGLVQEGS
jgi:hypothetical protein